MLICDATDCDAGAQQQWDQETIFDIPSAIETGLLAIHRNIAIIAT
jgi:hypothetical protein